MIMIIINRSCFSAVVPRPCAADVEPLRLCRGEGWAGGTLVNNYPVAGRCQKPINRPGLHSTTLHRPKRPKMNMYAYTYLYNYGFFSPQSSFFSNDDVCECVKTRCFSPLFIILSPSSFCAVLSPLSISLSHSLALVLVCPPHGNNNNSST